MKKFIEHSAFPKVHAESGLRVSSAEYFSPDLFKLRSIGGDVLGNAVQICGFQRDVLHGSAAISQHDLAVSGEFLRTIHAGVAIVLVSRQYSVLESSFGFLSHGVHDVKDAGVDSPRDPGDVGFRGCIIAKISLSILDPRPSQKLE